MERDFWLSLDLLRSPKDHVEFTLVRDWIRDQLAGVASRVTVEVPKSVLKQVSVHFARAVENKGNSRLCALQLVWACVLWVRFLSVSGLCLAIV